MGSYKAARRRARKEPVPLVVDYVVEEKHPTTVRHRDRATGELTEVTVENTIEVEKTETFTCRGEISTLAIGEMIAGSELDPGSEEGNATMREIFVGAFADTLEYRRFFQFAQRHLDNDDLIGILGQLVDDFTGRPTQPSSEPSPEPSTTGDGSKVVTLPGGFRVAAPTEETEQDPKAEASSA